MGQLCDKENLLWVRGTFPSLLSNRDICRSPATGACGHGKRSAVLFLQKTGRWLEVTLLGYEWRPHNLINHNTVLISAVICDGGRLGAQRGIDYLWTLQLRGWFAAAWPSWMHYGKFRAMKRMRLRALKMTDGYTLRNIWPDHQRFYLNRYGLNVLYLNQWSQKVLTSISKVLPMILAPCSAPVESNELTLPGTKDTLISFCNKLSFYQSNLNMIKLNYLFAPNKTYFQGRNQSPQSRSLVNHSKAGLH